MDSTHGFLRVWTINGVNVFVVCGHGMSQYAWNKEFCEWYVYTLRLLFAIIIETMLLSLALASFKTAFSTYPSVWLKFWEEVMGILRGTSPSWTPLYISLSLYIYIYIHIWILDSYTYTSHSSSPTLWIRWFFVKTICRYEKMEEERAQTAQTASWDDDLSGLP